MARDNLLIGPPLARALPSRGTGTALVSTSASSSCEHVRPSDHVRLQRPDQRALRSGPQGPVFDERAPGDQP
eukprot:10920339-Heterocapsa_arctica.AAC.1